MRMFTIGPIMPTGDDDELKNRRRILLGGGPPSWVLPGAAFDNNFLQNMSFGASGVSSSANVITTSRASSGTDLLPTSASGASFNTFTNNVPRITPNVGLLSEESRINNLLNSTAPVTQTTASLGTGTYTLWVNGSGSATSSAGSATGSGFGAATNGTPNVFAVSVAGTVTITVSGSLRAFQCELGTFGTSLIVTAAATATRAADVVSLTSPPIFGTAYSLFAQTTINAPAAYAAQLSLLEISDGTTGQRALLARSNGSATLKAGTAGGTGVSIFPAGTFASHSKAAAAFAAGNQSALLDGGAVSTGSAATLPTTPTVVNIGTAPNSGGQLNGYIERIALWPTIRLTDAQLQAITK